MIIRLIKGRGKPDMLACTRADGSTTWTRLHPALAQHDLVHYALESEVGLRSAFYGLVARGVDITTFERPQAERGFEIPLAARQAEFVVGLLQTELADGAAMDDFLGTLRSMLAEREVPEPAWLTEETVERVRATARQLLGEWAALEPGAHLELSFDEGLG